MPAMSRKSSSSTPSASDTAFIGTIYVAGHEAYGAQTCQKCGQGWPWAVFKRKADGNRDQRYIQLARKQIKAEGADSSVPSILLGKEKDLHLSDLRVVHARDMKENGHRHHQPTTPYIPTQRHSHAYRFQHPQRTLQTLHPPPLQDIAQQSGSEPMTNPTQQALEVARASQQHHQSRQQKNKQLHDDAVQAARLATVRANQEASRAEHLRAAQALAKQAAVQQYESQERARPQQALSVHGSAESSAAIGRDSLTSSSGQQQHQHPHGSHSNGAAEEEYWTQKRGAEAAQIAKASILGRLAKLYGSASLLGLDVAAEAVLPLQIPAGGNTRVGLTNEELGLMILPEPLRTKSWVHLNYTLSPPSITTLVAQTDVFKHYDSTIQSLWAQTSPDARSILHGAVPPLPLGRDFVHSVRQAWPETVLQLGQTVDASGALAGPSNHCFSRLMRRTYRTIATLQPTPQQVHDQAQAEARQMLAAGHRPGQHSGQHPHQPDPASAPINIELAQYVQALPSIAPAATPAQLASARQMATIWHALGRPYRPHGNGTYGQRCIGPKGYICVFDDDRMTWWQGQNGDVQQRAVNRSQGKQHPSGTATYSGSETVLESAKALGANSAPDARRASYGHAQGGQGGLAVGPELGGGASGQGQVGVLPDADKALQSQTPSLETANAENDGDQSKVHASAAAPVADMPKSLAAGMTASTPTAVVAPRFSTGTAVASNIPVVGAGAPSGLKSGAQSTVSETPTPRAPSFGMGPKFASDGQIQSHSSAGVAAASRPSAAGAHAPLVKAPVFSMGSQMPNAAQKQSTAPRVSRDLGPVIKGKGIQVIELDASRLKQKRKRSDLESSDGSDAITNSVANPFDLTGPLSTAPSGPISADRTATTGAVRNGEWDVLLRGSTAVAPGGESTIVTPSAEVLQRAGIPVGSGAEDEDEDMADMDMVVDLISEDVTRE